MNPYQALCVYRQQSVPQQSMDFYQALCVYRQQSVPQHNMDLYQALCVRPTAGCASAEYGSLSSPLCVQTAVLLIVISC